MYLPKSGTAKEYLPYRFLNTNPCVLSAASI